MLKRFRCSRCVRFLVVNSAALLWAIGISFSVHAQSFTYLVGGDGAACDFNSIQPAIDAAASHPGRDTIRIAMNATYNTQALHIGEQDLEIVGGYATCASTAQTPDATTAINGAGGAANSVLVITGAGTRTLSHVLITGGDDTDSSVGGGIDFAGTGTLALSHLFISNNKAGYGGGINFNGSGGSADLILLSDVVVQDNIATNSGGGIRVQGNATLVMLGTQITVTNNEARGVASNSGYGGGIQILPPARAEIASPGRNDQGVVALNRAKYGGGIALSARDDGSDGAYLLLYSVDPRKPVRINNNVASIAGGGTYQSITHGAAGNSDATFLCAYDFRIDHNRAPGGAAMYLDSDTNAFGGAFGAVANLNVTSNQTFFACGVPSLPPRPGAASCLAGVPCNLIDGNIVSQATGQAASGAIVELREAAELNATRIAWRGNTGTDVIHGLTTDEFQLSDCLIVENTLAGRPIAVDGKADIRNCTFANNTLGISSVLSLTGDAIIKDSIIWQPGFASLSSSHGALDGGFIISNDPASLPLPVVLDYDPRFIDPARGDFHLRAASGAVDVSQAANGLDLDGFFHDVDLVEILNGTGPRDLGAYERQSFDPLVLNSTFDSDLNLWNEITAGVSAFDPNENIVGGLNVEHSGAMSFNWINSPVVMPRVTSRTQCIHLPAPGRYLLNGSARTTGSTMISSQVAQLHWELRRDGAQACNFGPPDSAGDLSITSGTAWKRATSPAAISLPSVQWTRNSSIAISMVMSSGGIVVPAGMHGWFDGIELKLEADQIFKNGFE